MVVERARQKTKNLVHGDSGQSVLEFLLVLPVLMTIVMLIIRVNTAIQMSIVDQKYARQQALFISGNAADYPLRAGVVSDLSHLGMNQLVIGVSEEPPQSSADGGESKQSLSASTYYIGRRPGGMGENADNSDDITKRVTIRIRNTITLCLPMISINGKPAFEFGNSSAGSKYNYPEDPKAWQFCSSKLEQRT